MLEILARQAGKILRAGFDKKKQIFHKGVIDLVTEYDHQSEAFLVDAIRREFPTHRVITEEQGELVGEDGCIWYVDPMDGTVNYAHGVPIFAVSIAYQERGLMRCGVVYDPMRDECFRATRGNGAWLNTRRLHASKVTDLNDALLVTGFPYDIRTHPQNNLAEYARLSLRTQGVRRLGSAALDLCYVAASRFDGFWELRLSAWDVAAGGLIAEEAGAIVTNTIGQPDYISKPQSILAAAPGIYACLLNVLQQKES